MHRQPEFTPSSGPGWPAVSRPPALPPRTRAFLRPAEYTFPPGLSNHDRAVVHADCKKFGFTSKSFG